MTEWARLANTAGPAWAIVIMIGVALGWGVYRLFSEDGIVVRRLAKQESFEGDLIAELKSHNAAQLLKCEQHGQTLVKLVGNTQNLQMSDHAMLEAALAYMRANDCLQNGDKKRVEELLIAAKSRLENK